MLVRMADVHPPLAVALLPQFVSAKHDLTCWTTGACCRRSSWCGILRGVRHYSPVSILIEIAGSFFRIPTFFEDFGGIGVQRSGPAAIMLDLQRGLADADCSCEALVIGA